MSRVMLLCLYHKIAYSISKIIDYLRFKKIKESMFENVILVNLITIEYSFKIYWKL